MPQQTPTSVLFSIIMPTKNRAGMIGSAIQSVLDQTEPNWELIVVDDHSDDETSQVVATFNDPRIRYLLLEHGTGPSAARDYGIRIARGEYIVIADSDDANYPQRLTRLHTAFTAGADICYARLDIADPDGTMATREGHPFKAALLKCYNYIPNPTAAFRRSCYLEVGGYDHSLRTNEDYDLWLRFAQAGYHFTFIPEPLVRLTRHSDRLTSSLDPSIHKANLCRVRDKHGLPTPTLEQVKQLLDAPSELIYLTTPKAIDFWFTPCA